LDFPSFLKSLLRPLFFLLAQLGRLFLCWLKDKKEKRKVKYFETKTRQEMFLETTL